MRFAGKVTLLVATATLLVPAVSVAQNLDSLRALYALELPPIVYVSATSARTAPGSSASSPSAYGANWGDGFVGVGGQARTRYRPSTRPDGSVVAGFGLGNSRDHLGVEVAVTSSSTFRTGFGKAFSASLKLHRVFPRNFGVAVGWENAIHSAGTDGGRSVYGVVSSVIQIRDRSADPLSTLTLSLGAGDGRFRLEKDVRPDRKTIGVFGSAGLRLFEWASLIADWTGQDLAAGLSLVPLIRVPLVFTPAIADITGTAGDGRRLIFGVGMGFRFSGLGKIFGAPRDTPAMPQPVAPTVTTEGPDSRRGSPEAPSAPLPAGTVPFDTALLTTRVHFDFDSASLSPGAREALDAKVPLFLAYPDFAIRIEGHADARGVDEYNIALGQRRAVSARKYLVGRGVGAERVYMVSFGEERPLCTESTEDCWQRNRRAEFKILVGPR